MFAIGVYDLGLQPAHFWRLHPAQFNALMDRYLANKREQQYQTGIIASTIANVHRGKNTKPFKPDDFIPKPRKEMTPQEMYEILKAVTLANGGEVIG